MALVTAGLQTIVCKTIVCAPCIRYDKCCTQTVVCNARSRSHEHLQFKTERSEAWRTVDIIPNLNPSPSENRDEKHRNHAARARNRGDSGPPANWSPSRPTNLRLGDAFPDTAEAETSLFVVCR